MELTLALFFFSPPKTDLDLSGFEDLMRNNEKLREEKEELRAALSQLEEEVWQFRQKEVTVAKSACLRARACVRACVRVCVLVCLRALPI